MEKTIIENRHPYEILLESKKIAKDVNIENLLNLDDDTQAKIMRIFQNLEELSFNLTPLEEV